MRRESGHRDKAVQTAAMQNALANIERLGAAMPAACGNLPPRALEPSTDLPTPKVLALIAHELRTPMSPILCAAQMLQRVNLSASQAAELGALIERQASRLKAMVERLAAVGRFSLGKFDLDKHTVRLDAVLAAAVETCRPALDRAGHALQISNRCGSIELLADQLALEQVFVNLLDNAAKYTPDCGHIHLSSWCDAGDAVVTVTDTGIGLPADRLGEAFQLFSQFDRARDFSMGGLGIGLALVKQIVELHGGSVAATSRGLDLGSSFTVRLPLKEAS
ncbi:MAG: HAMP domain-containing sensor histidine kinase [Caldimonas sp.]